MPGPTTIAIIGLGLSAAGTIAGHIQSKKQAKAANAASARAADEQRKANEVAKRGQDLARAKEKRVSAKAAQRAIAEAQVGGAATGSNIRTSSPVVGAQAGIANTGAANTLFQGQQQQIADNYGIFSANAAAFTTQANSINNRSNPWGAIAGIGGQIFNSREDISTVLS